MGPLLKIETKRDLKDFFCMYAHEYIGQHFLVICDEETGLSWQQALRKAEEHGFDATVEFGGRKAVFRL